MNILRKQIERIRDELKILQRAQDESQLLIHDLILQNELLRHDLAQEREKRADELEKIELRLRLQMSEELRRLPPGGGN